MKSVFRIISVVFLGAACLSVSPLRAAGAVSLKRAEFEFHVGPAFALGKFGTKAFSSYELTGASRRMDYHGASIGVNYGLAFNFYASPNWGVLLLFNGHSNKVNTGPFSAFAPDRFPWETTSKDKWSEFMAMAGVTYRCRLADRFVLSARASIGYAHLISPFYASSAEVGNSRYTYKLNSASDPNFGYSAGLALKFLISRALHLDLRCDYMGAVPFYFRNVNSVAKVENRGVSQPATISDCVYTFHENFQMLDVSLGFTVAF